MRTGQYMIETGNVHYWVKFSWTRQEYDYDIIDWCIEHLGEQGWYLGGNNKIYFYNENDRLLFLLRWV